jgi:hypothetical protein
MHREVDRAGRGRGREVGERGRSERLNWAAAMLCLLRCAVPAEGERESDSQHPAAVLRSCV